MGPAFILPGLQKTEDVANGALEGTKGGDCSAHHRPKNFHLPSYAAMVEAARAPSMVEMTSGVKPLAARTAL